MKFSQTCDTNIQISRTLLDWVLTEKMALMTQNGSDDIRLEASESIKVSNFVWCAYALASTNPLVLHKNTTIDS